VIARTDVTTRTYLRAFVGKHPVKPGYGRSRLTNAKQISRMAEGCESRYVPTFNGVEIYAHSYKDRTLNEGEEDGKNNGQALVPIPHGPCP